MSFWDRTIKKYHAHFTEKSDPCEEKELASRFQQKKINVFVSSTFNDMAAERDELTFRTFPVLRKVCEERGISWGEVDLRWGIPLEKSEKGETLNICLEYIEKCRPYFIGILGERYGWVDPNAAEKVKYEHPWVKNEGGKSITELEILHGVLRNPEMATYAFFYFRDKAYLESNKFKSAVKEEDRRHYFEESSDARVKLSDLKERIRTSGFPVLENYPDPIVFGEYVKNDLMRVIDSLSPSPKPISDANRTSDWLDREENTHEAFASSRFGVYIHRQDYFDRLDAHVNGDSPPLVVLGESGCGKSALLAHWASHYRRRHPDSFIVPHYIGASSSSSDWTVLLRRLMGEFKRHFSLIDQIPERDDDLISAFRNWLSKAAAHGRVVIVIDALEQLEDRSGALDLVWLPPTIPENIRLIVSTLPGRPLDTIRKMGWAELTVGPLTVAERNALIICYLKKFQKELSPAIKDELASAPQCSNPLFLRALLEQVRIHGVFEILTDQIKDYLSASSIEELYEKILAGYESVYERDRAGLVKDTVSFLWAARQGLSKSELMEILGTTKSPLPDAFWAPLFLAIENSLIEKDGRITFSHQHIRNAVVRKYITDPEYARGLHLQLGNYFEKKQLSPRILEELPWQLCEAGEWSRLIYLLSDEEFLTRMYEEKVYDLRQYWVKIEEETKFQIVDIYQMVLKNPQNSSKLFLHALSELFHATGRYNEAKSLYETLIDRSEDDPISLESSLGNLALILRHYGDLKGAMALLEKQEQICRGFGLTLGLATSLGNQSTILFSWGDYDKAMVLLKEMERICRESGYKDILHNSLVNQGRILEIRGDLDNSMALYREAEQNCREMGNIDGLLNILSHQADILSIRGDPRSALALHKEVEKISKQFGNVEGLQKSLGNQAKLLSDQGDLDEALELNENQERLCREMGDDEALLDSLSNQAKIYFTHGNLTKSMALLKEQEVICKNLGNLNQLASSLSNQALILADQGNPESSLLLHKEAEQIYRDLGDVRGINTSLGNQALILQNQGNLDEALNLHREEEQICREIGDVKGLQASLGNQANIFYIRGDLDKAMKNYKEKERICRNIDNKNGLEKSLGSQALILKTRGDLEGAMKLLKEQEQICRSLKITEDLKNSLGNQAEIFCLRGELKEALNLNKEEERICRDLDNKDGLQNSLGNRGNILYALGDLDGGMALHKEKEQICREINNQDGLQNSFGNQALILKDRGNHTGAMVLLKEQERICRDLGNMDSLQNSLGNQAGILILQGDWKKGMKLLKEQEQICRERGFSEGLIYSLSNQSVNAIHNGDRKTAAALITEASILASDHGYKAMLERIMRFKEKFNL